ncbi:uncharacterized protein LOC128309297, partial [Anopheles moucheti]|uniref:uncharacterized protein LOC128309297 n=1 Tax=Anopheles moucheti TaxID=186751 RepID=UPI0022F06AD3
MGPKKAPPSKVDMMRVMSQIHNLESFIETYTSEQSTQCEHRLKLLESCWQTFDRMQTTLEDAEEDEAEIVRMLKERNDMYDRYCFIKGHLTSSKQDLNSTLPKISLPTFDGKITSWLSFKDRFTAMVASSNDIPDVMKLEYLLASLKGDVAKRFEYVDIAAENYSTTWKALLERYDNIRALK